MVLEHSLEQSAKSLPCLNDREITITFEIKKKKREEVVHAHGIKGSAASVRPLVLVSCVPFQVESVHFPSVHLCTIYFSPPIPYTSGSLLYSSFRACPTLLLSILITSLVGLCYTAAESVFHFKDVP